RRWSTRTSACSGCCERSMTASYTEPRAIVSRRDATPGRGRVDESADGRKQLRLVEQKRVVALVALDLDERDVGGDGVERLHDLLRLPCRVEPVAGERHDAEPRPGALECVGQHVAMLRSEVEVVHRARN